MQITVIFSGLFSVLAGVDQEDLDLAEGTTIERLSGMLASQYEKLRLEPGKTYFMVNGVVSKPTQVLAEGDQVRVFQILAGG